TEARVRARGRITRPTALLIDKSGSMSVALEVGKRLGALISAVCDSDLWTYAFDTAAHEVRPAGPALADWEKALAPLTAGGGTSCGAALAALAQAGRRVEQVVLVTDEGDNSAPLFKDGYANYTKEMNVKPGVIVVRVGSACEIVQQACK